MKDDLQAVEVYYEPVLIEAKEAWETVDCRVAEAPFVIKHKGMYYLTYSANHTRSKDYAVGYAVSVNPTGPLSFPGNLMFIDRNDEMRKHHEVFNELTV